MKTQIRHLIADALYQASANMLPSVCERFGMEPGTREEAFSGKKRYILVRLEKFSDQKVFEIANQVIEDFPDEALRAAIEKIEDAKLLISDITRNHLAKALDEFSLGGNKETRDVLVAKFWPAYSTGLLFAQLLGSRTPGKPERVPINSEVLAQAGFLSCSQQTVFHFLVEILHPARRDADAQKKIVEKLNPILARDGYHFVPGEKISGYSTYKIIHVPSHGQPADTLISEALLSFDAAGISQAWMKALDRRGADPEGAITAARSLLETVCKHILDDAQAVYGANDDLPKLYGAAAAQLNLAPSQHTETIFKTILGSCQAVVTNLAGLRNKLGDSHGQGRGHVKPQPRHAELAVNLAGSVAMYLIRTWEVRQKS